MKRSRPEGAEKPARRTWRPGVRARLLVAFLGIAVFAMLAAAAGLYAFREVGIRLEVVDARIPPTLSALELSRSAERIIAAAPALLAAADRRQRDKVRAELAVEVKRLEGWLLELKNDAAQARLLDEIEPVVSSITDKLTELEGVVARRLEVSERLAILRRGVFQTSADVQRLLAPWLEVLDSQISALVNDARQGPPNESSEDLQSLINLQRLTQTAQRQVSNTVDMLAEASTTGQAERLTVLDFQLGLALRDLQETSVDLDPRLEALFAEQIAKLREYIEGPDTIAEARREELALVGEGERLVAETADLSGQLAAAVDRLGSAARQDIGAAIQDALGVQRLSARVLVALVGLSLLTSVLIVWLYVGRNIVRRLTALSEGMLAIAGGSVHAPLETRGTDEIAAMGKAVEIFRRNTLERDRLLAEKVEAAGLLEKEVRERTAELETANAFKVRFLAAASHDLRQPLHALNLFVAQLHASSDPAERDRLAGRIDAAVSSMNELFAALLDMSKLEAGVLEPELTEFPVDRLLKRIETTFAQAAREKGLRLAVVLSSAWVRSDFVLLERILLNLVSNAVRYTETGGVVVGCRHRGGRLRIDICDTGPGIPEDQQREIFGEFYRLAEPDRRGGLGLGLAIVERLGHLLGHEVRLISRPGCGSCFSVLVLLAAARGGGAEVPASPVIADPARGKLVVVIDDDPLALESMGGILRSWGCKVIAAGSGEAAHKQIASDRQRPDLIVADYRLADGTGTEAIERLRNELDAAIPAFLVTGDTAPERLRDARDKGFHLLHKPVEPMRLRAVVTRLLTAGEIERTAG